MPSSRERRNRRKLLWSAITLAVVIIAAAVAERQHLQSDPLPAVVEATRSRTIDQAARPVFGTGASRPDAAPPQAVPAPPESPPQENGKRGVPADLLGVIERWRSSLASGDVDAHVAMYAPRLERFQRRRGVSRVTVGREKSRLLDRYPQVNRLEIHDVKLDSMKGDRAAVTFRRDWDANGSGSRRYAGSERQRLTFQRSGGSWKIVGEEELKVHWVRRS